MQTKTLYVCEYCNAEFNNEKDAQICEEKHDTIEKTLKALYNKRFADPSKIILKMKNVGTGKIQYVCYSFDHIITKSSDKNLYEELEQLDKDSETTGAGT